MDIDNYYRCPICSSRSTAVVVPLSEKAAHIELHNHENQEGGK